MNDIKLILLGDAGVRKTSIMERITKINMKKQKILQLGLNIRQKL